MATLVDSFLQMSRSIGEMQQTARAANPLTGLPGNVEIERHILDRLEGGVRFAVLYCDLDNFKAYNDCYGFARGDQVILYTRDCLTKAAETAISPCFVGHQGGDDFVVVCTHEDWERVASSFVALFDHGIARFYNEADRARGFILSKDRQDREQRFPLMSVSVAAVSNQHRRFDSFGQIVATVSEVKHLVKGMTGSVYAMDRRGEQE
jgi:GGDEF domain-containing protein